jgi:hypothetical protein
MTVAVRAIADHPVKVQDPYNLARVAARLLGARVDQGVRLAQLVAGEHSE